MIERDERSCILFINYTFLDPLWLLFDNEQKSEFIDVVQISWNSNLGQISELEIAIQGTKPADLRVDL